ncbi:S8 family serine peptidase, partial [Cloacibacillus evryensis]|uniref:S8 family serine peptidase n=1 Tax=Cloacibacillus evryensis TaxID=508460 RepID=UPI00210E62C5
NISVGDWEKKDGYNFDKDTNPVAWSIKAASDAGIIVCIAAGNEYQDLDSPGTAPKGVDYSDYFEYPATFRFGNTISVGASASDDTKASFSNYSSSGA